MRSDQKNARRRARVFANRTSTHAGMRRESGGTPWLVRRSMGDMRPEEENKRAKAEETAQHQIELAAAELAILKQELVLQHLIDTREPSEEARVKLERLRELAETLTTRGRCAQKSATEEAA
jgi:hypothetical protein